MTELINYQGKQVTGGLGTRFDADNRSFYMVVGQTGNALSQGEFNLIQQIINLRLSQLIKHISQSGFVEKLAYVTPGSPANTFFMPAQDVYLNGWWIHVADPGGVSERTTVTLSAPPGAGTRQDLVFLEMWQQEVAPLASVESDDEDVPHYGGDDNVNLTNDILIAAMPVKPAIGGTKESTRRVQLRWRIRVVDDVDLATFPAGMTDPQVLAQGGQAAPVATYIFTQDPVDLSLWVAGDGTAPDGVDLDSVDGRVYAVPLATVARVGTDNVIDTEISDVRPETTLSNPPQILTVPLVIHGADDATPITTGKKQRLTVDFPHEILGVTVIADAVGSIVVDINRGSFANFPTLASICAAARPTLSATQKSVDFALTGWNKIGAEGDVYEAEVDTADGVLKNVSVNLKVRRL
jgi:hypothetical protein